MLNEEEKQENQQYEKNQGLEETESTQAKQEGRSRKNVNATTQK